MPQVQGSIARSAEYPQLIGVVLQLVGHALASRLGQLRPGTRREHSGLPRQKREPETTKSGFPILKFLVFWFPHLSWELKTRNPYFFQVLAPGVSAHAWYSVSADQ